MRIESSIKMGYYPTPTQTLNLLCSLLQLPTDVKKLPVRLLDPCAGDGLALKTIGSALGSRARISNPTMSLDVETIGIELSDSRAEAGSTRGTLSTMIHADAFDVSLTKRSCSLLFLNPPYDHEVTTDSNELQKKKRLEETFLRHYLQILQPDGLFIYIVPRHILAKESVARYISNNIKLLSCTKIAAAEYEQFKQVILIGTKRPKMRKNDKLFLDLIQRGNGSKETQTLDALAKHVDDPEIEFGAVVPRRAVATENFRIKQHHIPPATVIKFATESRAAYSSPRWLDLQPDHAAVQFQPVVPLRTGHIGSLISSGQMGTVQLDDIVAKGSAVKRLSTYNDDNKRCHRDSSKAKYEREHFETTVTTLDNDGTITEIATVHEMEQFLRQHAPTIASVIDERYAPLYSQPEQKQWDKLAGLMHAKKLPGRAETGMLPTQKHIALASAKCLKKLGWVDTIGEMGVGKSVISLATVHLLDLFPAIVHCPGHITEKWAQEVRDTFNGEVEPYIITSISDLQKMQTDMAEDPKLKAVAILSKEKAKLGSGWTNEPMYRWTKIVDEVTLDEIDPATKERKVEKQVRYVKAIACPKCGTIHRNKKTGDPTLVPPTKRTFCKAKIKKFIGQVENAAQGETKRVTCNEPFYQFGAKYHRWPIAHYIRKKMDGFFKCHVADECHVFKGKSTDQAMAYHSLIMACDYTINLTGTMFGGKASDLFWMRYRIDPEIRRDYDFNSEMRWARKYGRLEYTIIRESAEEQGAWNGKTRTLSQAKEIPGISPLVYARLLKSTIFAKVEDLGIQLPEYQEEIIPIPMATNQAEQYHFLHDTLLDIIKQNKRQFDSGAQKQASALLSVWLQNSLARPNSCFRSEFVMWKNQRQIEEEVATGSGKKKVIDIDHERIPYLVNAVPQVSIGEEYTMLGSDIELRTIPTEDDMLFDQQELDLKFMDALKMWFDYFRSQQSQQVPMALLRVIDDDQLLPKERWLVQTLIEERNQRRKSIIYVRQTGTRDIQPRLQRILTRYGLRTRILPKSLEPAKRDGWIKKHARDIDVLITNPKKVATGLDLIQFSTIVNYELDYSLFVMWQSIRRVWRLGQTKPVRILFPVYEGTMEAQALTLMGQKMKAALLLYGDNAASAIADEASDAAGDILSELANSILDEERSSGFSSDGITNVTGLSGEDSGAGSLWDELNDIVEGQFHTAPKSAAETEPVETIDETVYQLPTQAVDSGASEPPDDNHPLNQLHSGGRYVGRPFLRQIERILKAQDLLVPFRRALHNNQDGSHFATRLEYKNNTYMPLVIEARTDYFYVAHCGEQNGDTMYDPCIEFRRVKGGDNYYAFSYENHYFPMKNGGHHYEVADPSKQLHKADKFANELWATNLKAQSWHMADLVTPAYADYE